MFELSIAVDFEAAHCIRDYPGKCNRLHGHNWKVEVAVIGTQLDELGMLMDFHDLKAEVNNVLTQLDHYFLNDLEEFKIVNPTAENIAKYIYDKLKVRSVFIGPKVRLLNVKIWESPRSAVTYSEF